MPTLALQASKSRGCLISLFIPVQAYFMATKEIFRSKRSERHKEARIPQVPTVWQIFTFYLFFQL